MNSPNGRNKNNNLQLFSPSSIIVKRGTPIKNENGELNGISMSNFISWT